MRGWSDMVGWDLVLRGQHHVSLLFYSPFGWEGGKLHVPSNLLMSHSFMDMQCAHFRRKVTTIDAFRGVGRVTVRPLWL